MANIYYREYAVSATIDFELYDVAGATLQTAAAHAAGDTKIMKDEGAEGNTTNGFTDEGQGYSIVLTAAEMSAKRIVIYVVDQTGPPVWIDQVLIIETYGQTSSAQHDYSCP